VDCEDISFQTKMTCISIKWRLSREKWEEPTLMFTAKDFGNSQSNVSQHDELSKAQAWLAEN